MRPPRVRIDSARCVDALAELEHGFGARVDPLAELEHLAGAAVEALEEADHARNGAGDLGHRVEVAHDARAEPDVISIGARRGFATLRSVDADEGTSA